MSERERYVDDLNDEIAALRTALATAIAERDAASQRAEDLRDVLREVEWNGGDFDNCPACGQPKCSGHATDCALAAAIKEG